MKLSGIYGNLICSLSYSLLNKARGPSGYIFQMYSIVWIMWLAFFTVGMFHPLSSATGLQNLAYSLMPAAAVAMLPALIPVSVPVLFLTLLMFVIFPYMPVHAFWLHEKNSGVTKRRQKGMHVCRSMTVDCSLPESVEVGFPCIVSFRLSNPTDLDVENVWLRWVFPGQLRCDLSQMSLGALARESSGYVSMPFVPLSTGRIPIGSVDLYFEIRGQKYTKNSIPVGACNVNCSCLSVNTSVPEVLQFGKKVPVGIYLTNRLSFSIDDVQVKCSFQEGIDSDVASFSIGSMQAGSGQAVSLNMVPKIIGDISLGQFNIELRLNGNVCHAGPVGFEVCRILAPDLHVRMNRPDTLYKGIPASIGFIVENCSDEVLSSICLSSCFSSQIECMVPTVSIDHLLPASSRYISLGIRPLTKGKTDLGNLNVSFEVNNILCRKEPIVLGVHRID
jgi:hypothetical protein